MAKQKRQSDLDPKARAKKVEAGNLPEDERNLQNSYDNITGRDVPNVVKRGTGGRVSVKPGKGIRVKP